MSSAKADALKTSGVGPVRPRLAAMVCGMYRDLVRQLEHHRAGVQHASDPETLHDFRVATRRIRSGLAQIQGVLSESVMLRAKDEFRELGRWTNQLRDLEVLLACREPYLARVTPAFRQPLAVYFDRLAKQVTEERAELATRLDGPLLPQILERFKSDLAAAERAPGPNQIETDRQVFRAIRRQFRRVRRRAQTALEDTGQLHALRIQFKRLRYLLDFFGPLLPAPEMEQLTRQSKALQTMLGEVNDLAVQIQLLDRTLAAGDLPRELELALAMLCGSLRQSLRDLEQSSHVAVQAFLGKETRRLIKQFKPRQGALP